MAPGNAVVSVMGLDVGTTGAKAVIYSAGGHLLGRGYAEYPLHHPRPEWSELEPEEVWRGVTAAIRSALAAAGKRDPVQAICAASQGEACVPLDRAGRSLGPAIASFDPRSAPQAARLVEALSERSIFTITGMPPHAMYSLCKILWWKEHRPDVFRSTHRFLTFGEYVVHRLGIAAPAIDRTMAARTMAMDLETLDWSEKILDAARIERDLLPPIAAAGSSQGTIGAAAASDLGLPAGVEAVTGGHDQPCGALGAGVTRPGTALDATGTVECITAVMDAPRCSDAMLAGRYPSYPHVVDGRWITIAFNFTGGVLLRWFRDQLGEPEVSAAIAAGSDPYAALIASAASDAAGVYVLPHFAATGNPWFDTQSAGALVGLRLSTSRGELIKAVLDGITYEIRLNLERLAGAGPPVSRLRAVGGGARSATWLQLKADIFGMPVATVNIEECAAFGAALLAGEGCGVFASAEMAAQEFVRETRVFEPDPTSAARHTERFHHYEALYPALRQFYRN